MAATVDFTVSRIGPIVEILLLLDRFVPIRDNMISVVAATGVKIIETRLKLTL